MKKRILKVLLLLGVVFCLTGCGRETINLNDYTVCNYEGFDRLGTAVCEVDYASMVEDHFSGFKLKKNYNRSDKESVMFKLSEKISASIDKSENLRNQDVIALTWNDTDKIREIEKIYKVKLDFSDTNYTVEGLTELTEVNPFDYSTFRFEGMSGSGRVTTVQISDEDEMNIHFNYDKNNNLSNGDQVTASIKFCMINGKQIDNPTELAVARQGFYFTEREKTATVEGLPHYARSIDEIPEENINDLYNRTKEMMETTFIKKKSVNGVTLTVDSVEIENAYLLVEKNENEQADHNLFYLVVKAHVTTDAKNMPDTFYYSGECSNVIISADGSCSKLDMNQTLRVNDGWGTTLSHYLKSVERFEEKNIKPQENKYECQKKY